MSSRQVTTGLTAVVALFLTAAASAQTGSDASDATSVPSIAERYRLVEDFQEATVVNAIGEEIGSVSNLIVDGNEITHVIISIGGFVGLGGSDVVVPFDLLSFDGDHATIETIASSDQIETLVPFDPVDFGLSE